MWTQRIKAQSTVKTIARFALAIIVLCPSASAEISPCTPIKNIHDSINQASLLVDDIVRYHRLPAPMAARLYAIHSIALHDAYQIARAQSGYLISLPHLPQRSYDLSEVLTYASFTLIERHYPYSDPVLTRFKDQHCLQSDGLEVQLGRDIGDQIYEQSPPPAGSRRYDPKASQGSQINTHWITTPPYFNPPILPLWAISTPFELQSAQQFRPEGPPSLDSQRFMNALNQVAEIGAKTSLVRTDDQTQIALFWADEVGTSSGPGHWNAIWRDQSDNLTPEDKLNSLLLMNIAMYDAGIAAWDAKYHYEFWRPHTALHALNEGADKWSSYLENPTHPEYVSGHSVFSSAAATILTRVSGKSSFCIGSEGLPAKTRCFDSFKAAAAEAGLSRIYGGIHFSFSNEDGLILGQKVADWVWSQNMPLIKPPK